MCVSKSIQDKAICSDVFRRWDIFLTRRSVFFIQTNILNSILIYGVDFIPKFNGQKFFIGHIYV